MNCGYILLGMINNDAPARNSLKNHCPEEAPGNTLGTIWNILRTSRSKEIFPPTLPFLPPSLQNPQKEESWTSGVQQFLFITVCITHLCLHLVVAPSLIMNRYLFLMKITINCGKFVLHIPHLPNTHTTF